MKTTDEFPVQHLERTIKAQKRYLPTGGLQFCDLVPWASLWWIPPCCLLQRPILKAGKPQRQTRRRPSKEPGNVNPKNKRKKKKESQTQTNLQFSGVAGKTEGPGFVGFPWKILIHKKREGGLIGWKVAAIDEFPIR